MLEKLQIVKNRFDEVSDLIIQPDIHTQVSKDIYARCDVIKVISKAPNNNL